MKSADSRLFCEAFFVLRQDTHPPAEGDMLAEANRILDEHLFRVPKRRRAQILWFALTFVLGAAVATLVLFLFFF